MINMLIKSTESHSLYSPTSAFLLFEHQTKYGESADDGSVQWEKKGIKKPILQLILSRWLSFKDLDFLPRIECQMMGIEDSFKRWYL